MDIPADQILDEAMGDLKGVVVIGRTHDGKLSKQHLTFGI
jgi:hypothetical protein